MSQHQAEAAGSGCRINAGADGPPAGGVLTGKHRKSKLKPGEDVIAINVQTVELTEVSRGEEERNQQEEWTAVLMLDHIRSKNRYIGLLERWAQQLQLTGGLLLGRSILVVLQGTRPDIKVPADLTRLCLVGSPPSVCCLLRSFVAC